jgi:hypothetical protein
MSALDHLRSIARGERPADDALLGNARCAWGRGEVIGEEAILAAFCSTPFALDEGLLAVETTSGAALVGVDDALIADLYDSRIGRLWRVGLDVELPAEQAVDVPFDADMRHERGDVSFRLEDHPGLDADGARRVLAAARAYVDRVRRRGGLRLRAFVVRAFATPDAGVALLALFTLSNENIRSASFSYAILGVGEGAEPLSVGELSQPSDWTPRL